MTGAPVLFWIMARTKVDTFSVASRVGMGFVVDVHQLADGGVRVFLRGGEGLVAEQFLNGAQIRAIGEQVRGKRVAQGMGVQIPIYVDEADVFLDDAAHGALGEAAACVIQENGLGVEVLRMTPAALRRLE